MNRLELIDIHKDYDGQPLLEGVNFHVDSGEILCLLGSSGSGKSTILRIIAGIERQESGKVLWNDREISDVPVYRRNFGLMFQDYALFPHLNVLENVAFGLRMHRLPMDEILSRVRQALARVNMESFAERRVTDLSGGEQQRIALARALAPDPQLLMLDEPLAALDRNLRVELQEELRSLLRAAGIPVVYVTHDQEEAILVSDRLALLNQGRIVQIGSTEQVFQVPANRWAARFLGMTNLLSGTVSCLEPLTVQTACGKLYPSQPDGANPPTIGERVSLLVKPLGLSCDELTGAANSITGMVMESQFLGDHYKVKVELCENEIVCLPSLRALDLGQRVSVQLKPGDLILLQE